MNSESTPLQALRPRPLSPHLQVYSWLITSTLSILHRLTGVVLSLGLLYLSVWLIYGAYGAENYNDFIGFATSPIGLLILFGWSVALNYHFLNGIRHLIWDTGRGLEIHNVTKSGWTVLVLTVVVTATEWAFGLGYL